MKVEVEETINQKRSKTANAETQMMGFYKNFIGKMTQTPEIEAEGKLKQPDIRERISQKLEELKST